ncbi:MAG: hypothetical protein JWN40_1885 [Phycisphaerales bacterium]|nr:hypothetical protein [Phycisphaerales bacterium]
MIIRISRFVVFVVVLMLIGTRSLAADWPAGIPIDEFPISYWCGPMPEFATLERYREIKEAGFTFVMPMCAGADVELNRKILGFCQQVGLKAFVADGRMPLGVPDDAAKKRIDAIVADYAKHPAFLGYHLVDEPGAGAYPALGQTVAYLKEKDPEHPAFINLLPNHCPLAALGTKTYEEYLSRYVKEVRTPFFSYDNYFSALPKPEPRRVWVENLEIARKVSLEARTPFWQIILVTQHFGYASPTIADLRYEAFQTLAYGGRGVLWFTYWSPEATDKTAKWRHAMIDPAGKRDPHFDEVRTVNGELQALGRELLRAESLAVTQMKQGAVDVTLGRFKAADGATLLFVANADRSSGAADVAVPVAGDKAEQFDIHERAWKPIQVDRVDDKPVVKVSLTAGGGALLRWR